MLGSKQRRRLDSYHCSVAVQEELAASYIMLGLGYATLLQMALGEECWLVAGQGRELPDS